MKRISSIFPRLAIMLVAILALGGSQVALAQDAVVRTVLFYSPTCPHCHQVITVDLPPLVEEYGDQLQILLIDTTGPEGGAFYQGAIDRFNIPDDRRGVPTLIIGDVVLVGSYEIPTELPGLIEQHLDQGGVSWPDIPGLAEAIAQTEYGDPAAEEPDPAPDAEPEAEVIAEPPAETVNSGDATTLAEGAAASLGPLQLFMLDPVGNSLSVIILLGMLITVSGIVVSASALLQHKSGLGLTGWRSTAILVLSLIGLGVAAYLAYVETKQVEAVCGPVGDCNTVQQSPYARLFGILPIGVLGSAGYVFILMMWIATQFENAATRRIATALIFGAALVGTLFSIYLTFLEPFVIGATCAWCLTSALTMTLILIFSAPPGITALAMTRRDARRA